MPFFISPLPYRIIRLCLALIFIYAGAVKLIDPKAFARIISSYDLIPGSFLPFVAIGLPILEVLAGIGLSLDLRGSLTVIAGLLLMFFFVLGTELPMRWKEIADVSERQRLPQKMVSGQLLHGTSSSYQQLFSFMDRGGFGEDLPSVQITVLHKFK